MSDFLLVLFISTHHRYAVSGSPIRVDSNNQTSVAVHFRYRKVFTWRLGFRTLPAGAALASSSWCTET